MGSIPGNRVPKYARRRFGRISKGGVLSSLLFLCVSLAGCGQRSPASTSMDGPEVIVERFYAYISEAKLRGGGSPAREAFKLISAERSRLRVEQFLEVIRKYPPGFKATIDEVEVNGGQAIATISYQMPSLFDGGYTMTTEVPLTIDRTTNTWKVDFTGETHGMGKDAALKAAKAGQLDVAQAQGGTTRGNAQ